MLRHDCLEVLKCNKRAESFVRLSLTLFSLYADSKVYSETVFPSILAYDTGISDMARMIGKGSYVRA